MGRFKSNFFTPHRPSPKTTCTPPVISQAGDNQSWSIVKSKPVSPPLASHLELGDQQEQTPAPLPDPPNLVPSCSVASLSEPDLIAGPGPVLSNLQNENECPESIAKPSELKSKPLSQLSTADIMKRQPYQCDKCIESFNRKTDLRRHRQQTHEPPKEFNCLECGKTYNRRDHLERHRRLRHSDGKVHCLECGKGYHRQEYLENHVRMRHGGAKKWSVEPTESSNLGSNNGDLGQGRQFSEPPPSDIDDSGGQGDTDETGTGARPEYSRPQSTQTELPLRLMVFQSPTRSESSFETTETCIEERKRQVIDRVVQLAISWLLSGFTRFHQQSGAKGAAGTSPTAGSSSSSNPAPISNQNWSNSQSTKRSVSDRWDEEDDDDKGQPPAKVRSGKGKAPESLRFACPYFKYNQAKYQSWRSCPGPGWPDVHRVKEHLYRRHKQPKYRCGRCWEPFEDELSHLEHQRNLEPCSLRPVAPVEGFDAAQEARLKSRKKTATELSEVEKWNAVFRVLFPHVQDSHIPSPFYEYDTDLSHGFLNGCEQYILREVPPRLRQLLKPELDRDLSIVEEGLKKKAIDAVKELLIEAFREFRQMSEKTTEQTTDDSATNQQKITDHCSNRRPLTTPEVNHGEAGPSNQLPAVPTAEEEFVYVTEFPDYNFSTEPNMEHFTFDGFLGASDLSVPFYPGDLLGEIPTIETLLQYPDDCGDGSRKKPSNSGYESNSNSPAQMRRDFSEP